MLGPEGVIRGDAALFGAYLQTFDALATDVLNLNAYRIADGDLATRAYFFPRGSGGDTVVSILNNVTCGAGARIRVAMAFFTAAARRSPTHSTPGARKAATWRWWWVTTRFRFRRRSRAGSR